MVDAIRGYPGSKRTGNRFTWFAGSRPGCGALVERAARVLARLMMCFCPPTSWASPISTATSPCVTITIITSDARMMSSSTSGSASGVFRACLMHCVETRRRRNQRSCWLWCGYLSCLCWLRNRRQPATQTVDVFVVGEPAANQDFDVEFVFKHLGDLQFNPPIVQQQHIANTGSTSPRLRLRRFWSGSRIVWLIGHGTGPHGTHPTGSGRWCRRGWWSSSHSQSLRCVAAFEQSEPGSWWCRMRWK